MTSRAMLAGALGAALFALACGGDTGGPNETIDPVLATISFPTASIELLPSESRQLLPVFLNAQGQNVSSAGATWASSDSATVRVNDVGSVIVMKLGGPVAISVTLGDKRASVNVIILAKVGFEAAPTVLGIDSVKTVAASFVDYYGTPVGPASPAWTTSNASVVNVDATGRLSGIAAGTATITATVGASSAQFAVEAGVFTPIDGEWRGISFGRGTPTFRVRFGSVRSFDWPYVASPSPMNAICTAPVVFAGNVPLANSQFQIDLTYGGHASATFSNANAGSLTVTGLVISPAAYTCSGSGNVSAAGTAGPADPVSTLSLSRVPGSSISVRQGETRDD